ncbi:MAG: chloride channel protein [Rhodobacteraceae bacterium]|nr:MAG: chloride channel protein [Paracoccaceae bacterium]
MFLGLRFKSKDTMNNDTAKPNHLSPFARNRIKLILNIFVFGLITGVLMAIFANIFVNTVSFISSYRTTLDIFTLEVFGTAINYLPIITLVLAASVIIIIRNHFEITRWNGPADSIYAAHRTDNELDTRVGYFSSLVALISASGGSSVGLYGPLVHLGATIGTSLKAITKDLLSTDVFIGCGVAGAISAGFGAPLAGIIFAHEAVLRHFSMRALAPIAIASFTASAITEKIFNKSSIFQTNNEIPELANILPVTLACSPIFAISAIAFMMCIRTLTQIAAKSNFSPIVLIYSGAIICGVTGIFVPQVLGLGTESINQMLSGNFLLSFLIIILILKILMTSICLSSGLFGGIFAPALFIGTATGSIVGKIVSILGFIGAGSVLPFCGMAAVGGAIIGAPVTAVIIIVEITGSYSLGLSTMASVAGCCLITHLFFGHSFFDRQLIDRGINVNLGRGHLKLMEEPVLNYTTDDFCRIDKSETVNSALHKMIISKYTEAYIMNKDSQFLGKLIINDLIDAKKTLNVLSFITQEPLTLNPNLSVLQSIEACRSFVGESIPIVDPDLKKFHGVISEADLFSAYLDLDKQIKDLENG